MNSLYPVFLKLSGRPCVVIGGGRVALQKVEALAAAGARLSVISPEMDPALWAMADEHGILLLERAYQPGDLDGAFLAVVATNDRELNERIRQEALHKKVLCNVVDDPERCDFYVPSIVTTGDLKIAISTNGQSPTVAKKLRGELGALYGPVVAEITELLARARHTMRAEIPDYHERGRLLSDILGDCPLYDLEREGQPAVDRLRKALQQWI